VRELKELGLLLLGFVPWLLFLFLAGHSLASLELASVLCFAACLTFGFSELRAGYILQWGTLVFFACCVLLVNVLHVTWVAVHMDLLANLSLASIIWLTLLAGRPFALQYACKGLPKERWNDPAIIGACRFITLVWALVMTVAVGLSIYKRTPAPQAGDAAYFAMSLALIFGGIVFTTLFKRHKRLQKERGAKGG